MICMGSPKNREIFCDDVGDDAHIVPKNYDKYSKTVGATLRGRPKFSPHPSFACGKTHLPLKGKACKGDKRRFVTK